MLSTFKKYTIFLVSSRDWHNYYIYHSKHIWYQLYVENCTISTEHSNLEQIKFSLNIELTQNILFIHLYLFTDTKHGQTESVLSDAKNLKVHCCNNLLNK